MIKHLLAITILLSTIFTQAQVIDNRESLDKHKDEASIIGHWKGVSMSAKCDALPGFNELIDNPMLAVSMKAQANAMSFQFMPNKKLVIVTVMETDTVKYEIAGGTITFISTNREHKLVRKTVKIISLTDDALIYSKEVKTSDPSFGPILQMLNAKNEINKAVTYTYTFRKIREAKAPWAAIENDLPKNETAENLVANTSGVFAIIRGNENEGVDSVFVSKDYGKHWNAALRGLPKLSAEATSPTCMVSSGEKIFIGTQAGIFSSENNGQAWTKINSILFKDSSDHLVSLATSNNNIVALVDSVLYVSKDNGLTWVSKLNSLPAYMTAPQLFAAGSNIIIGGMEWGQETSLLFSSDNGDTWSDIGKTVDKTKYPGLVSTGFTAGTSIFMSTQYGLFVSKDKGARWDPVANGLPSDANSNKIIVNNNAIFCGGSQGVFLSVNNGDTWSEVNNEELRKGVTSLAVFGSNIYALTRENKMWKASINELVGSGQKSQN